MGQSWMRAFACSGRGQYWNEWQCSWWVFVFIYINHCIFICFFVLESYLICLKKYFWNFLARLHTLTVWSIRKGCEIGRYLFLFGSFHMLISSFTSLKPCWQDSFSFYASVETIICVFRKSNLCLLFWPDVLITTNLGLWNVIKFRIFNFGCGFSVKNAEKIHGTDLGRSRRQNWLCATALGRRGRPGRTRRSAWHHMSISALSLISRRPRSILPFVSCYRRKSLRFNFLRI